MKLAWYPHAYVDEIVPEPEHSADAWLVATPEGTPAIRAFEPTDPPTPLVDGEVVEFVTCADHGTFQLRLDAEGGYSGPTTMPAGADQCCILEGWQSGTIATSIEECVAALRAELAKCGEAADGEFTIAFYAYSAPLPHIFDAAARCFRPAGVLQ